MRIETAGNPVFNGRITTDGDITVTGGGQFRLARSQEVVLKGGNITLTANSAPLDGRHPITIEAKGNLNLNTGLNTSMALTLTAGMGAGVGTIQFDRTKATVLQGDSIRLTGDVAVQPIASNQALTITAAKVPFIAANLNAGKGVISITAGAGTPALDVGIVTFTSSPVVRASQITLTQDAGVFGAAAGAVFQDQDGLALKPILNLVGALTQGLVSWGEVSVVRVVAEGDVDLTSMLTFTGNTLDLGAGTIYVRTSGRIIFPTLTTITTDGDITLIGSDIQFPTGLTAVTAANLTMLATGRIGGGANLAAFGNSVSFTADTGALRLAGVITMASGHNFSLSGGTVGAATNMPLTINSEIIGVDGSLNTGTGALTLNGGGSGAFILRGSTAVTYSAGEITIIGVGAPTGGNVRSGVGTLSLISRGNINMRAGLNMAGNLVLEAGAGSGSGTVQFDAGKAITLRARSISLRSDRAPAASGGIELIAAGDIILGQGLDAGANALKMTAGDGETPTGKITFEGAAELTYRGRNVRINSDAAPLASAGASGGRPAINNVLVQFLASNHLFINAQLRSRGLGLEAGNQLRMANLQEVLLAGGISITLDGANAPTVVGANDITIESGGHVFIYGAINTTGALMVEAGAGAGFGRIVPGIRAVSIAADDIILRADLASNTSPHDISVMAAGDLTLGISLLTAGDLTFAAGVDGVDAQGDAVVNTGMITFEGTGTQLYRGANVSITSDTAPVESSGTGAAAINKADLGFTVISGGNLSIDAQLRAGSYAISTPGELRFGVSEDAALIAERTSALAMNIFAGTAPTVSGENDVTLTSAGGVRLLSSITTTGDISITAGGSDAITLSTTAGTQLEGANIALRAGAAPAAATNQRLALRATGDITINQSLNAGTGLLLLAAGG